MILGIGQSSENKFLSENMNVQKGMVDLRMETTVFEVMCQLILGHCDIFMSDSLRRLRGQDSQFPNTE